MNVIRLILSFVLIPFKILKGLCGIGDRESDAEWRRVKEEERWEPRKAPFLLRLPVIRYPRYLYHAVRLRAHTARWMKVGLLPNFRDEWVLYGIYRGWC